MIFALSGLIIGLVMGLTGAGGALVAIPLFMTFLHMELKEASVLSLIAVVIASGSSYFSQRSFSQYKTALSLIFFSSIGSFISAPYKLILSDIYIAGTLSIVSLYALITTWLPKNKTAKTLQSGRDFFRWISIPLGLLLGFITTLTGLGGGVLMMPILLGPYSFEFNRAVATSLFVVALSSLFSLVIQFSKGLSFTLSFDLIYLALGILLSNFLIKFFLRKLSSARVIWTRKIVFTLVVVISLFKIL